MVAAALGADDAVAYATWLAPILLSPFAGGLISAFVTNPVQGRPAMRWRSPSNTREAEEILCDQARPVWSAWSCKWNMPLCCSMAMTAFVCAMTAARIESDAAWLWADCLLCWALLALALIDLRHLRLPDALTLPLMLFGLATNAILAPNEFLNDALGMALGYATFRTVAIVYLRLRDRDGLGLGDAKLLGVAGAWDGWERLADVMTLAAVFGLATALIMRAVGHRLNRTTLVPFGPCLALALWICRVFNS